MKIKSKNNKIINELLESSYNKKFNDLIEKQYKENYIYFYKIAYSILNNNADAEDAITESFIKFYKHKEKISKIKCPEITPYLVSIVRNLSFDMKKAKSKILLSESSEGLIDSIASSESADTVLLKKLEKQELYQLLDILNETEYDIFELRVIDKLRFKEIGQKLNISEEAAKKRYQRLIKKLREESERRSK